MHLKMHKLLVIFYSATIVVHFSVGLNPNDILENPRTIEVVKKSISNYKNSNKTKNDKCAEQFVLFLENLEKSCSDDWAIQMIDASAKMPSGKIDRQNLLGLYVKCLSIKSIDAADKAQYCFISPTFNGDGSFSTFEIPYAHTSIWNQLIQDNRDDSTNCIIPNFGICLPAECNEEDVALLLDTAPTTAKCQSDQKMPINLGALITIGYFGIFIMLILTSTIYDVLTKNGKPHPLLLSFSIRINCKKLFSTKKNPHHQCLYGLKVISMIWVLAGHNVMTKLMFNPFSNSLLTEQYELTFESIVFISALNSTDTFLVITGCIITYNYMKMIQMGNWFNIGFCYNKRKYLRLAIIIIPMLLLTIFLTKYIIDDPLKPVIDPTLVEPCRKYWWSTLLFIGDANDDNTCVLQTWYLNVDLQLYQITPFFLYLVSKYPKFGIGAMVGTITSSIVMSFMDIWNLDIEPDEYLDIHAYLYYFPLIKTRAATWFIGCVLGYFLAEVKLHNQNISTLTADKWSDKVPWLMVFTEIPAYICLGICSSLTYQNIYMDLALYTAFASIGWGILVARIISACSNGIGGGLNKVLSMPIFQILSRFVFSVFIVHLNIMFIMAKKPKEAIYFPAFNFIFSFVGSTLIIFIVSLFWVLAIESPISRVEDYFLKDKYTNNKNIIDENNNLVPHVQELSRFHNG